MPNFEAVGYTFPSRLYSRIISLGFTLIQQFITVANVVLDYVTFDGGSSVC